MSNEYVRTHRDMYRVVRKIKADGDLTVLDVRDMAGSERLIIEQRAVAITKEDVLRQVFLNTLVSLDEMRDFGLTLDEVQAAFTKAIKKVNDENNNQPLERERVG